MYTQEPITQRSLTSDLPKIVPGLSNPKKNAYAFFYKTLYSNMLPSTPYESAYLLKSIHSLFKVAKKLSQQALSKGLPFTA
jgi:hypothetical protein